MLALALFFQEAASVEEETSTVKDAFSLLAIVRLILLFHVLLLKM
jgi:hypothetical protein